MLLKPTQIWMKAIWVGRVMLFGNNLDEISNLIDHTVFLKHLSCSFFSAHISNIPFQNTYTTLDNEQSPILIFQLNI